MNLMCLITYRMEVTLQTQAHVRAPSSVGWLCHCTRFPFFKGVTNITTIHLNYSLKNRPSPSWLELGTYRVRSYETQTRIMWLSQVARDSAVQPYYLKLGLGPTWPSPMWPGRVDSGLAMVDSGTESDFLSPTWNMKLAWADKHKYI